MKNKFVALLKREEIPQFMLAVLLLVALASSGAAMLGPLQLGDEGAAYFYAHENIKMTWLFILGIPIVSSLLSGICMTLWKLKYPSED